MLDSLDPPHDDGSVVLVVEPSEPYILLNFFSFFLFYDISRDSESGMSTDIPRSVR